MTQTEIIRMIRGSQPVYTNEAMNYLYCRGLGHYVGGHVDEWRWESESSKCWNLPVWDLLNIYRDYCEHKRKPEPPESVTDKVRAFFRWT